MIIACLWGFNHPEAKFCPKCKCLKLKTEFTKSKNKKDGLYTYCKQCKKLIAKGYYDTNAEVIKQKSKEWRNSNPEKKRISANLWNRKNPKPARRRALSWAKKNPSKYKAAQKNRRARELNAPGIITDELVHARMAYYGFKCIYCSGKFEHADHFKSLSKGGSNWPANFVPSCSDCNLSKGTRNPWVFITEMKQLAFYLKV